MNSNDDQYLVEEPLLLKEYKADNNSKTRAFKLEDLPKTRAVKSNDLPKTKAFMSSDFVKTSDNLLSSAKSSEFEFEMQVDSSSKPVVKFFKKVFIENIGIKVLALGVAGVLWILIAGLGAG